MMMSSCSKEDVAEPEKGRMENGFSNERGGGLQSLPKVATTDAPAGNNAFATGWEKKIEWYVDHLIVRPAGTSTKTHLWGDQNSPWTKPFLNPPGATIGNENNFVTLIQQNNVLCDYPSDSKVKSTIKNLKPGKKYAITVSMASSVCLKNGEPTQYAKAASFHLPNTVSTAVNEAHTVFDLTGKEAEWVTKTITFEAKSSEVEVYFSRWIGAPFYQPDGTFLSYIHGFIGENAVVEVP